MIAKFYLSSPVLSQERKNPAEAGFIFNAKII